MTRSFGHYVPRAIVLAILSVVATVSTVSPWLGLSLAILAYMSTGAVVIAIERCSDDRSGMQDRCRLRKLVITSVVTTAAVLSLTLSVLVPPLQSPDENAHLQRAYSLLDNQFLIQRNSLDRPENQEVDAGLRRYIDHWQSAIPTRRDRQVTAELEIRSREPMFAGHEVEVFNGAAAYFPVLYAPASVGLGLARGLGQPVWIANGWARAAMAAMAIGFIALALIIARAGMFTMAGVTLLPMTLAQLGSSNLDAMSISLGLLAVALLTSGALGGRNRGSIRGSIRGSWTSGSAWVLLALLVWTKPVFLAVLAVPLYWGLRYREDRTNLIWTGIILVGLALWVHHMAQNFVDIRVIKSGSTMGALGSALLTPLDTIGLLWTTLVVKGRFYWESMIGVLGWLDTPLTPRVYGSAALLLASCLIADALSPNQAEPIERAGFVVSLIAYLVLSMLVMLAAWVPPVGGAIEGVQGRYFLPVLPLLALALGSPRGWCPRAGVAVFAAAAMLYLFVMLSELPRALLYRFWM
jgi:uncharacterized membrane protein